MLQQLRPKSGLLTGFYTNSLWCIVGRQTGTEGPCLSPEGNCGGKCNYLWLLNLPLPLPSLYIVLSPGKTHMQKKEIGINSLVVATSDPVPLLPIPWKKKCSLHLKHHAAAIKGDGACHDPHCPLHLSSSHSSSQVTGLLSHSLVNAINIQDYHSY